MNNRAGIYYWKCDRPHAFHSLYGTSSASKTPNLKVCVKELLSGYFGNSSFTFRPSGSQGNHIAYIVSYKNSTYFLRIENGPEGDNYMEIEAKVLDEVRSQGVPAPRIYLVDVSRKVYPFAFQLMEYLDYPDLNRLYKDKILKTKELAVEIGKNIAQYQNVRVRGYGLFDPEKLREDNSLTGLYNSYHDYFFTNWERHLDFLVKRNFLSEKECEDIRNIVNEYTLYLQPENGCLVHKDMALWNILGTKTSIKAIIDWDDAISGDPSDDISLLACFHSGDFITSVLEGYSQIRKIPGDFIPKFWLHLLRNMIVKSVIRVGAGYFDLKDDFFLIDTGKSGNTLKKFTMERIQLACRGLNNQINISDL